MEPGHHQRHQRNRDGVTTERSVRPSRECLSIAGGFDLAAERQNSAADPLGSARYVHAGAPLTSVPSDD
jgi:hypothetical protein